MYNWQSTYIVFLFILLFCMSILYFCSFFYFVWRYVKQIVFNSRYKIFVSFKSTFKFSQLNENSVTFCIYQNIYMYECICIMNVTGIINHYLNTRTFTTSLNQKVSNSSVLQTSFNMSILDGAMCNIVNRIIFHKIDSLMLIIIWSNLKFQIRKL